METLRQQYKLVQGARGALLGYLGTIPFKKLHAPVAAFENRSVCYLLHHTVITYLSWLNEFALKVPLVMTDETAWDTMNDVTSFYKEADDAVYNFLSAFEDTNTMITGYKKRQNITLTLSVLQLFTHVVTHEFHHKGTILGMTRMLGYVPVDTDIIRT